MDSAAVPHPRARPAHTQGTTRCAYTPDGARLVTAGSNNTIRLYRTGHDGEPVNIDDCQEQNLAVAAAAGFLVAGAEDGTVSRYSLASAAFERYLVRSTLPVRDVALSPDGRWCAVASDELSVRLIHVDDPARVRTLAEHNRPTKHVAFQPGAGGLLALSCSDGVVYVYTLAPAEEEGQEEGQERERPDLLRRLPGLIGALDGEAEASSRVVWHPSGKALAVPTPWRTIQVVSTDDWEKQRVFQGGHLGDITALAWSPNGALLASAGRDGKLLLWETKTQTVVAKYDFTSVTGLAWHPTRNVLSLANSEGEVYIHDPFVPEQHAPLLRLPEQPVPFIHDPSAQPPPPPGNGHHDSLARRPRPAQRRDSLGSSIASFLEAIDDGEGGDAGADEDEDDGFVVDDDGAGYAVGRKRGAAEVDTWPGVGDRPAKRRQVVAAGPACHAPFQPGATPWRGSRKYLCLNLIGFVWTVDQDSHHTVTVEFYDHELQSDFHFTDTFLYDKACLTTKGALFACPPRGGGGDGDNDRPGSLFYRPHETWTQRTEWRIELPRGEAVAAMSLGDSFITVATSAGYVRVYTLFGIPHRVYRAKSTPLVTCASWRDYVITMGNGPVGPAGAARLVYSIEDVRRDEVWQDEDTVALPAGATVEGVFFSETGDPYIYDSTGTLLTLVHWRRPSRARWVPVLDTKLLPRLASGRKHESYYPVAVADNKFHCIILKGGDRYPYFPRPLLSEFEFLVPLRSAPKPAAKAARPANANRDDDAEMADADKDGEQEEEDGGAAAGRPGEEADTGEGAEEHRLHQTLLLKGIESAQLRDLTEEASSPRAGRAERRQRLARIDLDINKVLLQLLAAECRAGDERGMRALEMVELMRDPTGRMVEAALKVAERYGRRLLRDKIRELGERRLAGEEGGEDEEDEEEN